MNMQTRLRQTIYLGVIALSLTACAQPESKSTEVPIPPTPTHKPTPTATLGIGLTMINPKDGPEDLEFIEVDVSGSSGGSEN